MYKKSGDVMKLISVLIFSLTCTACATSNKILYEVTSNPPQAPIDVNGVSMSETPTEISLQCSKVWVGVMNSPDGWGNSSGNYKVVAYPPKNASGQSQSKTVDPCQWKGDGKPKLFFDLNLESVAPTQKIKLNINDRETVSDRERTIDALKMLRAQGVISEEEYNKKILNLLR